MERVNEDMMIVCVCQEFGWTYDEYINQPFWFIRLAHEKLVRDSKQQELAAKQSRKGR